MTTNPDVGRMAQSDAQLPLHEVSVIGLFSGPNGASALLRMRDGDIVKVGPGDRAGSLTVLSVDESSVAVRDWRGKTWRMALPQDA